MHPQAKEFLEFIAKHFSEYFQNKKVLDVGAGDINGNNRYLFKDCQYEGNDVVRAKNVTVVSKTKDLDFPEHTFDTVVSSECFEHDPEYKESILKIYNMLKPNGLFAFTCASEGRPEHGTRRTSPDQSFGTIANLEDMSDYYKNLVVQDINKVLDLNSHFSTWRSYYNAITKDLYFYGIKKQFEIPEFTSKQTVRTGNSLI